MCVFALGRVMKVCWIVAACFTLAACTPDPVRGTKKSNVEILQVGMNIAQVRQVLGAYHAETFAPGSNQNFCLSYLYNEFSKSKFVHVYFRSGYVVTATDKHKDVCRY
jgi:hypothetical protein